MALTRLNTNAYASTINLASNVTGTLPIANGGTAATTAAALANTGNLVLIYSQTASNASNTMDQLQLIQLQHQITTNFIK